MKETLEFNHKKQCGLWLILIGIVLIIAVICGGNFFVNPFVFLIGYYICFFGVNVNKKLRDKLSQGDISKKQIKVIYFSITALFILMFCIAGTAVELSEKGQKSQLAKMLKASLPNEWGYELAEKVERDYVQRNFVDKGMCADWAIHDSENDKGQRNLHIHVLLTMRPITENGEWGAKQKKIYDLDESGEKIPVIDKKTGQQKVDRRNRKQWKCHTADSADWNSKENAKMWRKDLADTINATNEQLGIAVRWEHRSFKEQGIDKESTIHIGAVANALERKGIQTERGNINREIIKNNMLLEQAKEMLMLAKQELHSAQYDKIKNVAVSVKNEVMEMIVKVRERKGRLDLPIVSGKRLRRISDSIIGNKARLNGGRRKFNVNFIVKTSVFLYN